MLASILIPVIIVLLLGRIGCSFFCPYYTIVEFLTWIRKKLVPECSSCNMCITVCPMGLDPQTEGDNILCHNCGDCIDICPDNKKIDTLEFKI